MAVEIQTLIFAHEIREHPDGLTDMRLAPIFRLQPMDYRYPAAMRLSFYLLLRKEAFDSSVPVQLTMKIIDEDATTVRLRDGASMNRQGEFEPGDRFLGISGELFPTFPRPGEYTVKANIQSEGVTVAHDYVIHMMP